MDEITTELMQPEKPIAYPVQALRKPMVVPITGKKKRVRTNLSTIQITDQQKQVIDQAYKTELASGQEAPTKGDFLAQLAMEHLQRLRGGVN